ncbi:hypothetical protein BV25DRAFT_1971127 [Artomyces pyxidatus]|uniref:Uncharacterized protein n=1 Tax=Artomyces pyxidatus TaxID=48021 RepID=A0ACB8TD96_9AGAM|nr:hypothetical protein BV25DRAFT_1971127 [Artomyces pyxidatus]
MATITPPLFRVPREVLENIALETVLANPVGPPSDLVSLLCTCSHVHRLLSFPNSNDLLSRIYRGVFDIDAAHRRLGPIALRTQNIAGQLRANFISLQRIRAGDIDSPHLLEDLWVAFVLLTENDGKNRVQLDWARAGEFVDRFVHLRLWKDAQNGWPLDTPVNALALWLMWGLTDREILARESQELRMHIISLVLPFVVMAFKVCTSSIMIISSYLINTQYHSFYAPDQHYHLPLPTEWQREELYSLQTAHGHYPHYRDEKEITHTIQHFGQTVKIIPPLIVAAATLIYFSRRESVPLAIPSVLPVDRPSALARGIIGGQTQADVVEVNAHFAAKCVPRGDWHWKDALTPEELMMVARGSCGKELKAPSGAWDNDWERITSCWDPWSEPDLKGVVYTFGSMDGLWQGRLLIPEEQGYLRLVANPNRPAQFGETSPNMSSWPMFMRLKEHHCINPQKPVPCGGEDDFDDGIRDAWFPRTFRPETSEGRLTFTDPEGSRTVYETFVEGRPNSHDPTTCEMCILRAELEEKEEERKREEYRHRHYEREFAEAGLGMDVDGDYEDEPTYDAECSGIRDIAFTGQTDAYHGMAWGSYTFLGRVRAWDGLIALIRIAHDPHRRGLTRWVFRGYLHYGQVLVGTWRGMTADVDSIPWEGAFIASKRA